MISLMWIVGFIVSQLIPFFNELLTVISSLFSVWFIYGYVGFMWFYDVHPWFARYAGDTEPRAINTVWKKILMGVSIFSVSRSISGLVGMADGAQIILSIAITPLGLYSAAEGIKKGYSQGTYKHPFSC